MQNVQIVTDSCAHFANPHLIQQYPLTIVANKIIIGGRTYREGVDLNAEDALKLMAYQQRAPSVQSPSEAEFLEVYTRLARSADVIISIHASREMYPSWQRGKAAAAQLSGNTRIAVIDSRTLSAGQAMLVRVAARAIEQYDTLEDIEREIRGAVERSFSVFYVESMNYLLQNRLMTTSHSILGTMLGIKPFLAMEDGRLKPMEKVRTRVQAIERLVEFAIEFTEIDDTIILQHKPHMTEQTRMLQDRLAVEFPARHFPYAMYGPSLAALIGTDATGLVILESELDHEEDDL